MKTNFLKKVVIFLFAGVLFSSCGSTKQVSRLDVGEVVDLSGRWNDVDSRLVSKDMINKLFDARWIKTFKANNNRLPVVIVGKVKNKSSEHIKTATFVKDIEKELINSGLVDFVASKKEREELREERIAQQSHSSVETAAKLANETGADFMLKGEINTINDAIDGKKIVYYQIDLELIDIETNRKVWMDGKKIKKYIAQDKYSL